MTQEDKELLIKDLCARLPYGVKVQYRNIVANIQYIEPDFGEICLAFPNNDYTVNIADVKPYLRTMSSMTDEEENEYAVLLNDGGWGISEELIIDIIDWLNKNMFDYRGLIPRDLAIEVTKENNPYKD